MIHLTHLAKLSRKSRKSAVNVQEEPGGTVCRGLALCTGKVNTVVCSKISAVAIQEAEERAVFPIRELDMDAMARYRDVGTR